MFSINKILVPTDFSDNATAAYQPAQQIAARYDAQIDYMHVVPASNYWRYSIKALGLSSETSSEMYPEMKKKASAEIQELMDVHVHPKNRGEHIVKVASKPSRAIAVHAQKGSYDLIVMAAKGHHESEFFSGSITKKIIRYSKVPVFSTENSQLDDLENILVPTDGSKSSLGSLPVAVSLASVFNADITMYNALVVQRPLLEDTSEQLMESKFRSIQDDLLNKITSYFAEYDADIKLKSHHKNKSSWEYLEGKNAAAFDITVVIESEISKHNAITDFAHDNADIVIMATHGRSGIAHALIGSVAEVIAKEANRPVITVQDGPDSEDKESA